MVSGWVTFEGPLYVDDAPTHAGPDWTIAGSKLPASIRSSGKIVLALDHERGLSSVPNLTIRFLSPDGARAERSVELLAESEFDHALVGDDAQKRDAFIALGDIVCARVNALNDDLDALGKDLVPMTECTIDPANPFSSWPPCGAAQTVKCGASTYRYLGGRQTLETPRGRRRFPTWRKPKVKSADGPDVVVNECIGGAWLDADAKVLALSVVNLCAVPGDWCSVESDWRFVGVGK
jgi:hypothetical protein